MKTKSILAISFLGLMTSLPSKAQSDVELSYGADLVSSYIWRGGDLGGLSIQPTLGISYKGLSLSAFGSYGLVDDKDTKELDFTLAYEIGKLTVGVTDYYCIANGTAYSKLDYFEYRAHETAHVFEAFASYDFGPASLSWYTNFAGADGLNKKGKRAYSSYVEAAAPFEWKEVEFNFSVGAVPYATDFYADAHSGFAVTSIALKATKTIPITTSFSLPMFVTLTANPSTSKCYMALGITLSGL